MNRSTNCRDYVGGRNSSAEISRSPDDGLGFDCLLAMVLVDGFGGDDGGDDGDCGCFDDEC